MRRAERAFFQPYEAIFREDHAGEYGLGFTAEDIHQFGRRLNRHGWFYGNSVGEYARGKHRNWRGDLVLGVNMYAGIVMNQMNAPKDPLVTGFKLYYCAARDLGKIPKDVQLSVYDIFPRFPPLSPQVVRQELEDFEGVARREVPLLSELMESDGSRLLPPVVSADIGYTQFMQKRMLLAGCGLAYTVVKEKMDELAQSTFPENT